MLLAMTIIEKENNHELWKRSQREQVLKQLTINYPAVGVGDDGAGSDGFALAESS